MSVHDMDCKIVCYVEIIANTKRHAGGNNARALSYTKSCLL